MSAEARSAVALARLADPALRARVDISGFHALIEGLPAQARAAWQLGMSIDLAPLHPPTQVYLAGMGGSAIGADMVATLAMRSGIQPVTAVRQYRLPPLTPDTLVILSSFSGNTEEVLSVLDQVQAEGAQAVALATGGRLADRARAAGIPLATYSWDGPPRTALGYGLFIPLAILCRLQVITLSDAEVDAAFTALDRAVESFGFHRPGNLAQLTAAWLEHGTPLIVGPDLLAVAAVRWAGEFAENAKRVAAAFALPEFDHNQIEAAAVGDPDAAALRFVLLDAPAVHVRNRLRVTHTADLIRAAGREVRVFDAGGLSPLEAILSASSLGTWASYYLALLREVDPAPVPFMEQLKRSLPPTAS